MNNKYTTKKEVYLLSSLIVLTLFVILNTNYVSSDILTNGTYNFTCDGSNISNYNMTIYSDTDGDNYTIGSPIIFCTNGTIPLGYTNISLGLDCNDQNNSQFMNVSGYQDFDLDNYTFGGVNNFCTNGSLPIGYIANVSNLSDCNDTNKSINPGVQEIFYNNIDDDCNVLTKDTFIFNITTLKDSYNINETVTYTIYSENSSNVNVTLLTPNNYYNYQVRFTNQTYPINDTLPSTRRVGEYIIQASQTYKNITIYQNKSINITNSISLIFNGALEIDQNQSLSLKSRAIGGYGQNYNYTYYLGDGNYRIGQNITYTYTGTGNYDLIVNVIDTERNQKNFSYQVTVYKLYGLKILTLDKSTNGIITGVNIAISDKVLTTGSDGYATFVARKGRYDLTAFKQGYDFYDYNDYNFIENSTLILRLTQIDNVAPKITLLNKTLNIIDGETQNLNFNVVDTSRVSCTLYEAEGINAWIKINEIDNITNSNSIAYNISSPNNSSIKYKIECIDTSGNNVVSEEGLINKVEKTKVLELSKTQDETITTLIDEFNTLKSGIEKAGNKEKEVITLLGFDKNLKEAERFTSSVERDIDAIQNPRCPGLNCNLTESEKQKKIDELILKTKDSVEKIPISLKVISSEEFVKYPTKTDIESILKTYFVTKGKILTTSQLKSLIEKTSLLQSKLTVSTKLYNVDMEYSSGEKSQITLVKKSLDLYDKENVITTSKNYVLLEDISASDPSAKVNLITKADKVKNDNLYELSLSEKNIVYTYDRKVDSSKVKLSNTVIISTSPQTTQSFTGFAIFTSIDPKEDWAYLLIAFVVLIILLRFLMWFGVFSYIRKKLFSNEKEYHALIMLVNDSKDYLDAKDLSKALLVYKEIRLKYEQVSDNTKEKAYPQILELCSKFDEEYLKNLIDLGNDELKLKQLNIEKFIDAVSNIYTNIYTKLKDNSKSMLLTDLNKIREKFGKTKIN